jgi:pentatricopeptide repeat protein
MALVEAASIMASAAVEAASLVWMELSMFVAAGLLYVLVVGSAPLSKRLQLKSKESPEFVANNTKQTKQQAAQRSSNFKGLADSAEYNNVLKTWNDAKTSQQTTIDLASVVDAMWKLGKTTVDVAAELRCAIKANSALLPNLELLPAALLRDDSVGLLSAVVALLEECGKAPDITIYSGLMAALLRRRDFAGVAGSAANVPVDAVTPRMRALLASAAAQAGRLDEALGHLRQMPSTPEGERGALMPAAAAHILALAAKDLRVQSATQELVRLGAKLESRHFDNIFTSGRRNGAGWNVGSGSIGHRELLDAATALGVPKCPGMYQALAGALAQESNSAGLRELIQELGSDGIPVTEALALALLDACRCLKTGDSIFQVADLHRAACAGAPGAKVLSATCSTLMGCDRWSQACEFYEKEMLTKNIWPDSLLTASLLKAAAQVGNAGLAQRLADHAGSIRGVGAAGSWGLPSDIQRQATMIKAHARERDLGGARAVFERVQASGAALTPLIYNALLDAMVHCGDNAGALEHFKEMKRVNLVDVVSYNTMLKSHLAQGRTDEAVALVKEMTSCGLQANRVTYNELLHAKVMSKDPRGVWNIIDEMHAAGVRANSVTCSILLKSLSVQSKTEDVKRITNLIDEVDEAIDEVLFSSVIEACIRIRQLDLLSDLMQRYKQKRALVNLSAPTYGSMIKAYGQAGDVTRVHELWHEMEERGVKPSAITLGCMTEALVINNQADEALQLIHAQLQSEERKGCINTVIYSTVLKGFAVQKRMDKVFQVYKEMRGTNIPCNTITYNTLLDACAKCSAMDRASGLLVDMKETAVEPDIITYSTIVKGYCMEGDVDRAFSVIEAMKQDDKFTPDEIMYNSILDGCAKQHRVEQALSVLEEMKNAGVGPSNYTLSILVKALGHARRLPQAFKMVEDLSIENGFRPNVQVYTCLVQACILNRRLEKAFALHDTMVSDSGCRVDDKFYAVLAKGCLQMQKPLKAMEVVRAAYQLPGHGLAKPANARVIGVESRALEEVVAKLQAGGQEEQDALLGLSADLLEKRGIRLGDGRRGGGGGGGGGNGVDRQRRTNASVRGAGGRGGW